MGFKQMFGAHFLLKGIDKLDDKNVLDKYAAKQRDEIKKAFPTRHGKIMTAIVEQIIFPYIEILIPDKIKLIGLTNRWMTSLKTRT